ncbi:MAG TPA: haloacid dehalogenase type II [Terriglobales bacterium]|nr:haloacid dehalogenase type II [Terriglobales bacterium]
MLDFSRFRLLSFDCYGTLIDWEAGIFGALHPILNAHGKAISDIALLELYSELEAEAEHGEFRPYREVLQSVVRGFGDRLGFVASEAEIRSLPGSLSRWEPFPDTAEALRQLKTRYQLAIISNVDDDLFAFTAPKLGVPFDFITTAQQARAYKPSLQIFKLAQKRMGISSAEWLHVAQSVFHDVVPAKSLGLATVWVNRVSLRAGAGASRAAVAEPDLEAPDLKTLAELALRPRLKTGS